MVNVRVRKVYVIVNLFLLVLPVLFAQEPISVLWWRDFGAVVGFPPAIDSEGFLYLTTPHGAVLRIDPDSPDEPDIVDVGRRIRTGISLTHFNVGYLVTVDRHLVAIDFENLEVLWEYELNGNVYTIPAVDQEGNVYVATDRGYLYALTSERDELWRVRLYGPVYTSVALSGENVYVADDYGYVYCVRNGKILWFNSLPSRPVGAPAIDSMGNVIFATQNGAVVSISSKGQVNWTFNSGKTFEAGPVLLSGQISCYVFVVSSDGVAYLLRESGQILSTVSVGGHRSLTPALGPNNIPVIASGLRNDELVLLQPQGSFAQLKEQSRYRLGVTIASHLVVLPDGRLYFVTSNGALYCVKLGTSGAILSNWPKFMRDFRNSGAQ